MGHENWALSLTQHEQSPRCSLSLGVEFEYRVEGVARLSGIVWLGCQPEQGVDKGEVGGAVVPVDHERVDSTGDGATVLGDRRLGDLSAAPLKVRRRLLYENPRIPCLQTTVCDRLLQTCETFRARSTTLKIHRGWRAIVTLPASTP